MIVAVPAAIPDTMPVVAGTVATAVLLLLHVPEPVAFDSDVAEPEHMLPIPVIGSSVLTVTTAVAMQPVDNV